MVPLSAYLVHPNNAFIVPLSRSPRSLPPQTEARLCLSMQEDTSLPCWFNKVVVTQSGAGRGFCAGAGHGYLWGSCCSVHRDPVRDGHEMGHMAAGSASAVSTM